MNSLQRSLNGMLRLLLVAMACAGVPAIAQTPANAVWIDVRNPGEFANGHLEGATLIPFDGIVKGVAKLKLERNAPIYLYCAVGGRAERARGALHRAGYSNVTNAGGLQDARAMTAYP